MRISADRSDPGFDHSYRSAIVFLNGKRVQRCITADEDLGVVIVHAVGADGNVIFDREKGEVVREEVRGSVRVVLPVRL